MSKRELMVWIAAVVLAVGSISAGEVGLTSVQFPEGKSVDVPISGTQRAPSAEISAKVKLQSGQSSIEISHKNLAPAVLFGNDIVSYVVWVVSPDGRIENVGGIANDDASKGTATFSTAQQNFALMITAEPIVSVPTPGELVVFFSGTPASKDVKPMGFTYGGLSDRQGLVSHDNDSIAGMSYKSDKKNPLELIQAKKAVELMDRFDAKEYDAPNYDKAVAALAEAEGLKGQKQLEASRRAVMLSGQALSKTIQMIKAEAEAIQAAEAAAEKYMLASEAGDLAAMLSETEVQLAQTTKDLDRMRGQLQSLQAQNSKLSKQRQSLDQTLSGALGQMASGSKTDRGYVVSLSGVAFQSGQSELSTEAKYVLAKLSGVLLVFPDMKLAIEGHTDSTGGEEVNRKLSVSRAKAVSTYLREMGIETSRMADAGFGPDRPIAPNDTAGGRAKNRRVDIVMAE